jgi:hypothetical protein
LTPRRRIAFSISAETSSSSTGSRRGRAGAEHDEPLRHLLVAQQLVAGDDAAAVDLEAWQEAGGGPGREQHVLRFDDLVAILSAGHRDLAGTEEAPVSVHALDLVLAEEELDSLGVLGDDLVLVLVDAGHLDADVLGVHADLGAGLRLLEHGGAVEQALGGDAAAQQAGTAEPLVALDHHYLEPELPRANGGDVAAGASADDREIVGRHASSLQRGAVSSLRRLQCQGRWERT